MRIVHALALGLMVASSLGAATAQAQDGDPFASNSQSAPPKATKPVAEDPFGEPSDAAKPAEPKPANREQRPVQTGSHTVKHELSSPTRVEFVDIPLQDAVEFLSDYHGIEIEIDWKALEAEGVASDTPVSGNLNNVLLSTALHLVLDQLDLTYVIRDNVLLITSKAAAGHMLELQVYDVSNLVNEKTRAEDFAMLISDLQLPGANSAGGGAEAAYVKAVAFRDLVVVRASQSVHEEIARLLRDLCDRLIEQSAKP